MKLARGKIDGLDRMRSCVCAIENVLNKLTVNRYIENCVCTATALPRMKKEKKANTNRINQALLI